MSRKRGVLAEGAKFVMISSEYDWHTLIQSSPTEIRSFYFFRMINPESKEMLELRRGIEMCKNTRFEQCRFIKPI